MLNLYRNTCASLVRASKPAVALTTVPAQSAKLVPACDQSKCW